MLNNGQLLPNHEPIHYVKVVAGKGEHTNGGEKHAVLKYAIEEYLEHYGYKFLKDMVNGVFLIEMKIKK